MPTLPFAASLLAAATAAGPDGPNRSDPPAPSAAARPEEPPGDVLLRAFATPRRSSVSETVVQVMVGGGKFQHDIDGSVEDDTNGGYGRLSFEFFGESLGGGLRLEGIASDDDLFAGSIGPAEATDGEIFVHITGRLRNDETVRVPVRFGLFVRGYSLEDNGTGASIDWSTVGVRAEVEPDIAFIAEEGVRWSVHGVLGGGLGVSRVETDPSTFDADTTMTSFDVAIGTRLELSPVVLDLGLMRRASYYDQSDDSGGLFFRGIDTTFEGVYIALGVTF